MLINIYKKKKKVGGEEKSHRFLLGFRYGTLYQGKSPTEVAIAYSKKSNSKKSLKTLLIHKSFPTLKRS